MNKLCSLKFKRKFVFGNGWYIFYCTTYLYLFTLNQPNVVEKRIKPFSLSTLYFLKCAMQCLNIKIITATATKRRHIINKLYKSLSKEEEEIKFLKIVTLPMK